MKRCAHVVALAGLWISFAADRSGAQWSAGSLTLVQSGGPLHAVGEPRTDVYSRVELGWQSAGFSAGARFELDRSSDDRPDFGRLAAYEELTQRWAEWRSEQAGIRIGNFYTLLGRGLLHRSWELPGVVYDETGTLTRYAASRDMNGAIAHGTLGPLAAQAFGGQANDGTVSPATENLGLERYRGFLQGAQLETRVPRGGRIGAAWTRFTFGDAPAREAATGFVQADLLAWAPSLGVSAPLYFEYAQQGERAASWRKLRRGPESAHAMYASLNLLWRSWTLAAEWKDYDRFRLGVNDPPSLVREHSAALLNRRTHVLDAEGEAGFQLEASAPLGAWGTLTANTTRSDGAPGPRVLRFEERFVEARVAPPGSEAWELAAFHARGFDAFDFVGDRTTVGVAGHRRWARGWETSLDVQSQRSRTAPFFGPGVGITDRLLTLGAAHARFGSASVSVTRTDDPADLPYDDLGEPTAGSVTLVGVQLGTQLDGTHRLDLFAGRRRGGRACTSGTCYEVPSLDGAELRWTARY